MVNGVGSIPSTPASRRGFSFSLSTDVFPILFVNNSVNTLPFSLGQVITPPFGLQLESGEEYVQNEYAS